MSLAGRILRITPVAIGGMLLVAVIGIVGDMVQSRFERRQREAEDLALGVVELERRMLDTRLLEMQLLLTRAPETIEQLRALHERMPARLEALSARLDAFLPDTDRSALQSLTGHWTQHAQETAELVDDLVRLGLDEDSGLQGRLREAVHAAEQSVAEGATPELMVKILMLRRHEKDFILRIEPKYVERFRERMDEIRALPVAAFGTAALREEVLGNLATYETAFGEFATLRMQARSARGAVAESFAAAQPALDAIHGLAMTELARAEAAGTRVTLLRWVAVALMICGAVVAVTLITRRLARAISTPLAETAAALSAFAEGRTDASLGGRRREDEIGEIARAFERLQQRIQAESARREAEIRARAEAEQARSEAESARTRAEKDALDATLSRLGTALDRLARGDLAVRVDQGVAGEFAPLRTAFNDTADRLSVLVRRIWSATHAIADATGHIAGDAADLTERATNQAASLEETAATIEQISATVRTNADATGRADTATGEVVRRARAGGEVVREAETAMNRIESSAARIAEINGVIGSIAFQTNLLALNAAVEAARAGEAGKGFAVVAAEVRTLAQRASEAAKDIGTLVQESSGHVGEGVRLVRETGLALSRINDAVGSLTTDITDISAASREQASAVAEIATNVSAMDAMTQHSAELAEQSAARARDLERESAGLRELVGYFELEAGGRLSSAA